MKILAEIDMTLRGIELFRDDGEPIAYSGEEEGVGPIRVLCIPFRNADAVSETLRFVLSYRKKKGKK